MNNLKLFKPVMVDLILLIITLTFTIVSILFLVYYLPYTLD